MKHSLTLEPREIESLKSICQYLEHEEEDFNNQVLDQGLDYGALYDEHDALILDKVPVDLRSHVYYLSRQLWYELINWEYGK